MYNVQDQRLSYVHVPSITERHLKILKITISVVKSDQSAVILDAPSALCQTLPWDPLPLATAQRFRDVSVRISASLTTIPAN